MAELDISTAQTLARNLAEWYDGSGNVNRVAPAIRRWITQSTSVFPLSADELAQALSRLESHRSFSLHRESVISDWKSIQKGRNGYPSSADATRFISGWLQKQDHGILFNTAILSGISRIEERRKAHGIDFTGHYYLKRDYWILHVTTRGKSIYIADREIESEKGDLVLISPDASCHFHRHPESRSWHHAWALFKPHDQLEKFMRWPLVGAGMYKAYLSSSGELQEVEQLLEKIQKSRTNMPLSNELCFNYLQQVFIRVAQSLAIQPPRRMDSRVESAIDYLQRNFGKPFRMDTIAAHCHLSLSRLSSLFRSETGMSLQKYRNSLRMQKARSLLATSPLSVQRISDELGYKNPEQFSKAFSKYSGSSPSQFKKQINA